MEWVVPSLERETPLKLEKSRSTSFDRQSGHSTPFPEAAPNTSFSNSDSHFRHLYSNMGISLPTWLYRTLNATTVGTALPTACRS